MFPTNDIFDGDSYDIIPWANRERILYSQRFGSYQGEWLIMSFSQNDEYKIYTGSYGSCSGCDAYQGVIDYASDITLEKGKDFAKDYEPFLIVPRQTMINLVTDNELRSILPANRRDQWEDDIPFDNVAKDLSLIVKLEEEIEITVENIIAAPNAESKQRALKKYGYENFVSDANMETIDTDGENSLLKNKDIVFVYVKDSSTPRRYLLRVPPNMTRVKQAIAWTFNMTEKEYQPIMET